MTLEIELTAKWIRFEETNLSCCHDSFSIVFYVWVLHSRLFLDVLKVSVICGGLGGVTVKSPQGGVMLAWCTFMNISLAYLVLRSFQFRRIPENRCVLIQQDGPVIDVSWKTAEEELLPFGREMPNYHSIRNSEVKDYNPTVMFNAPEPRRGTNDAKEEEWPSSLRKYCL